MWKGIILLGTQIGEILVFKKEDLDKYGDKSEFVTIKAYEVPVVRMKVHSKSLVTCSLEGIIKKYNLEQIENHQGSEMSSPTGTYEMDPKPEVEVEDLQIYENTLSLNFKNAEIAIFDLKTNEFFREKKKKSKEYVSTKLFSPRGILYLSNRGELSYGDIELNYSENSIEFKNIKNLNINIGIPQKFILTPLGSFSFIINKANGGVKLFNINETINEYTQKRIKKRSYEIIQVGDLNDFLIETKQIDYSASLITSLDAEKSINIWKNPYQLFKSEPKESNNKDM